MNNIACRYFKKINKKPLPTPPKKIALLLCGGAHNDLVEMHEITSALFNCSKLKLDYKCYSFLNIMDHKSKLAEYEHYTKCQVTQVPYDYNIDADMLFFSGCAGLSNILTKYKKNDKQFEYTKPFEELIESFYKSKRNILFTCNAPVILSRIFNQMKIKCKFSLGPMSKKEEEPIYIKSFNHEYMKTLPNKFYYDVENKLMSTPTYMQADVTESQVNEEIYQIINHIDKLLHVIPNKLHIERAEREVLSRVDKEKKQKKKELKMSKRHVRKMKEEKGFIPTKK